MKIYLDCYPCFLRQALEAARYAGASESSQQVVVLQALDLLSRIDPTSTPPEIGDQIHRLVRQESGHEDPYRDAKNASTRQVLALVPRMTSLLAQADDPLEIAVRLSIAGNIIDLAIDRTYDLWSEVERVLAQPFAIADLPALRAALTRARQVLFLADNAGETVFDRLLIENLGVPVIYAGKGGPILNDATLDDARVAGVDRVAEVVSTGSDAPGTILARCSDTFRQLYDDADLVIAKGQANYETLSTAGDRTFFLLQTKCPVIARDAGVPVRSILLKQGD